MASMEVIGLTSLYSAPFIRPYSDRGGYLVDGIKVVLLNKGGKFGSRHTDFHVYAGGSFITCLMCAKGIDMKFKERHGGTSRV